LFGKAVKTEDRRDKGELNLEGSFGGFFGREKLNSNFPNRHKVKTKKKNRKVNKRGGKHPGSRRNRGLEPARLTKQ